MNIWTIIVAAGSGSRFGSPKQLEKLAGKTVLERSIEAFSEMSAVVVVGNEQVCGLDLDVKKVTRGGDTRSESVRNGLAMIDSDADYVLIHDAARPLVSDVVINNVVKKLKGGSKAVVPTMDLAFSIRHRDGMSLDRSKYLEVQTPQGFDYETIIEAHSSKAEATDDIALAEMLGVKIDTCEGDIANFKITNPLDIKVAEVFVNE